MNRVSTAQIRKIWALARELQISKENLHIRIFALTKKEHIGWSDGIGLYAFPHLLDRNKLF